MAVPLTLQANDALTGPEQHDVVKAATGFVEILIRVDRAARKQARTLPTDAERTQVQEAFWNMATELRDIEGQALPSHLPALRALTRDIIGGWMARSALWGRSYHKPHGYAGDYRMLEWMYDLETDPCSDAGQPAIVNALDSCFASVHSVQAVWHRRRWFAQLLLDERAKVGESLKVLDIACGGSRYVRDALDLRSDCLELTALDQDPASIAFLTGELSARSGSHSLTCAPVRHLPSVLPTNRHAGTFDVTISTGLFDYLDDDSARALLSHLVCLTRPGGTVAVCNFSPEDRSRVVKDWISDWILIYRTEAEMTSLFPDHLQNDVVASVSPDGGLVYTLVRLPAQGRLRATT